MFCPECGTWNRASIAKCARCQADLPELAEAPGTKPDDELDTIRRATGGRYRVYRRLGTGGMANVYYAQHAVLERPLVIKALLPHLARDAEMRERFRREAEASSQLSHPHICAIMDYGEGDNILFDEDGNALITDFGIATARFHARLTGTGRAMGTPHYMSPEQAMGRMVDGRSDLYAVGVMLYEMLVGFPPFDGADSYSIGYKHVHEQAASPDVVDSRVPAGIAQIVMRCLAKSVAERYQRGNELADALIAFLGSAGAVDERRAAWIPRRPGATPSNVRS